MRLDTLIIALRLSAAIAATAFAALLMWLALPARAHDAPAGWTYPIECCSGFDCRQIAQDAVREGPQGYVLQGTGETVPFRSPKVRPSPDGEFHWCSVAGRDDGRTICLFVPLGSS